MTDETEELIIAGSGGQGILFTGELLVAAAGIKEEKNSTWFPSYGPLMRGGKATCTVVISSEEIGSPISGQCDSLLVMNKPSLEYVGLVKPGGLIIINKSLAGWDFSRKDVEAIEIEATKIAAEIGAGENINVISSVVMLGAYLKRKKAVKLETVIEVLKEKLSKKPQALELNIKALKAGYEKIK